MKKTLLLKLCSIIFLATIIGASYDLVSAKAVEKSWLDGYVKLQFFSDKNQAVADGKDAIKLTLGIFAIGDDERNSCDDGASPNNPKPLCATPNCNVFPDAWYVYISSTGPKDSTLKDSNGAPLSNFLESNYNNSPDSTYHPPTGATNAWYTINNGTGYNCSTGLASYYLTSNTSGNRKITAGFVQEGTGGERLEIDVNFTAPPTSSISSSTTSKPSSLSIAPTKPTLTSTILTKTTATHKTTTLTSNSTGLRTNETLTLTGTTSPNAKVTLTIQSNPITVDLTADKDGKWTYALNPKTLKLPLGNHTITAVATSSEGIKSDPVQIAQFTLKTPPVIQKEVPAKMSLPTSFYILLSLAIALIIVLVIVMTRSRFTNRKKEDEL